MSNNRQEHKRKIIRKKKLKWILLSVFSDVVLINLGFIVAFLLRFGGRLPDANFQAYTNLALYITAVFLISFYIHDLYQLERQHDLSDTLIRLVQANFLAIFATVTISFIVRTFAFPRSVFVIAFFTVGALVMGWRYFMMRLFPVELPEQHIAVVGGGKLALRIAEEIKEREHLGLRFAGLVQTVDVEKRTEELPILGNISDFSNILEKHEIDRVIITSPTRHRQLVETILTSEKPDIRLQIVPEIYEICVGKVAIDTIADIPLIEITYEPFTVWAKFGKRVFDIIASLFLLVLLSPLMLFAAILIKTTSEGPVIFSQVRTGVFGRPFTCYKFRTMVKDAETMTGPILAKENDTRITRAGIFLRKYRIDELPQLLNILKGDMSFVGPRPERPEFVSEFEARIPGYLERFKVRPGATGLAQIYGFYETSPETKLKYDLIYIYNLSFFLDMLILFKTISVVLTGKGAR